MLPVVTDAAIHIAPTLVEKRDMIQNAIDLAHTLGIAVPKVAVLSAVETVNPTMPSTVGAAALCKTAERGQIAGGIVDGPLAFDNAVSALAKQLTFLAGADAAGVVMGAQVPIILTSRADSSRTRIASCAVAVLLARPPRRAAPWPWRRAERCPRASISSMPAHRASSSRYTSTASAIRGRCFTMWSRRLIELRRPAG